MKRNDIKKLHDLSTGELQTKLAGLLKEASLLKLQKMGRKLKDTRSVIKINDDIARVKTILTHQSQVKA